MPVANISTVFPVSKIRQIHGQAKPVPKQVLISRFNEILKSLGNSTTLMDLPVSSPVVLDPAHPIQGKSYISVVNGNWYPLTTDHQGNVVGDGEMLIVSNKHDIKLSDYSTWDSYIVAGFETVPGTTYAVQIDVLDSDTSGTWLLFGAVTATYPSQGTAHSIIVGFKATSTDNGLMLFYQRKANMDGSGVGIICSVRLIPIA